MSEKAETKAKHEIYELRQMQSLSLDSKIRMTDLRIRNFVEKYGEDKVFVSLSGKDSSVLLHRVRQQYPHIPGVFINTGLEYSCVRRCALEKENVIEINPNKSFKEILINYGYPVIGKEVAQCIKEARKGIKNNDGTYQYRIDRLNGTYRDKDGKLSPYNMPKWKFLLDAPFLISHECCTFTKKEPSKEYEELTGKYPIMGTMACESRNRTANWLEKGCNVYDTERPMSRPISFWTENDIFEYILKYKVVVPSIYGDPYIKKQTPERTEYSTTGAKRTGCTFCLFGITKDTERFLRLKAEEPKKYPYVMGGGAFDPADGMWKPNDEGLGFKFVIDWLNEHGNLNIKY